MFRLHIMFRLKVCLLTLIVSTSLVSSASVNADEKLHDRVLHGEKLSKKEHFLHSDGGEDVHDFDYDHEAFLGVDEASEFDHLTPEESQRRLGVIVDKIDKDGDGFITFEEMRNWIRFTQERYVMSDVDRQWQQYNVEQQEKMEWESYRKLVYGFMDDQTDINGQEFDDSFSYKRMESRDQRRWTIADDDKDGLLTKEEFKNFLHPEEADHMRDIVVLETLDDIDKNGDGKISLEEYIGDMFQGSGDPDLEPDWVKAERDSFTNHRDENKDGFMDLSEVQKWILPSDYDHSEAESKHLILESDSDGDQKLTKEEILNRYDLFVGSQATDFGEALSRHDEF